MVRAKDWVGVVAALAGPASRPRATAAAAVRAMRSLIVPPFLGLDLVGHRPYPPSPTGQNEVVRRSGKTLSPKPGLFRLGPVTAPWTPEDAERHLLSLELFGMRFGLDRMRRLMTALGSPEQAFRSIHVVGTNGKSSTVRMIAAVLEAHGHRTGAYLSPHLVGFEERVRIGDEDVEPEALAAAVQRAAHAAVLVDRTSAEGDHVTQFELLTAAAYSELARRGVEVAVIEAGLGGRYDATSVIPSEVQVLTNVGLEHTRWLGPTVRDIAREKLAVVREGATLVVGAGLHPDAAEEAERTARERDARLVVAPAEVEEAAAIPGRYQRANFAL